MARQGRVIRSVADLGVGGTASSSASFRRECPAPGMLKIHRTGEPKNLDSISFQLLMKFEGGFGLTGLCQNQGVSFSGRSIKSYNGYGSVAAPVLAERKRRNPKT